ncbi:MAG TPA: CPBP family intramembrane metalloprotease, partial [Leucothrix sp.]|nr:CPBP family intramembrane metalloprotease [Leucothrix sp.]
KQSAVGLVGATLITASSWAIIHLQYGWYEIITIFLIGIVFAIAKHKTQSLYIPIFMHMLMNLTASVLMELS